MADERPDINLINCDNSDYGLADDKVRGRVTTIENLLNNKNISNINEMAFEEKKDQTSKDDLNNAVTTLNNTIEDMQENFTDSVDQIAQACIGAGSTPEGEPPYSPEAVAVAIAKIPQGGGGIPYSMFPQQVLGFIYGGDSCSYDYQIEDNDDVIVAHIVPTTNDSSIVMNFKIQLYSNDAGTVTFSLIVDDVVVVQDIASATFSGEYEEQKIVSFNYTFDPALTNEYHVIALRANMSSGLYSVSPLCPLCSLYGSNFEEVQNVGCYLVNNIFSNYYIPSGFTIPNNPPTNPIVYQLDNEGSTWGSCQYGEEVDTAMNSYYYDQFDSGVSFYMKGITNYEDPETHESITPSIADILIFSNGKFIYNHSEAKTYEVMEYHHFILPVIGKFFNMFRRLCIHGKMVSRSGSINHNNKICPLILERVSQNRVEEPDSYDDSIYCSDLEENEEFTLYIEIPTPENNNIQFIGFSFLNMNSNDDAFTIEIDKIQGEPSEY